MKAKRKKPADNYLWIKIWINILPVVFVVEALKKALLAHGVAWVALTPGTLFSQFINSRKTINSDTRTIKRLILCTSPDIELQAYICFVPERDFLKNEWLTVMPVLSYDAPSMSWCFTAALFTSHEVPEKERKHTRCVVFACSERNQLFLSSK